MNIIPHNPGNVQVSIGKKAQQCDAEPFANHSVTLNPPDIRRAAYALYDQGFNVFPQPYGKKGGYPWRRLQFTRLSRDNRRYGLGGVFVGMNNVAIMCGRTSGNLFVIDCESNEALEFHIQEMRRRKLPLWVVKSARGGHIYLHATDGEVHNIASGVLVDAEIKGQLGYVIAPPSLHPSGITYTWLYQEGATPPSVHSSEIDWLQDAQGCSVSLTVDPTARIQNERGNWWTHPPERTRLSRATREYLDRGHILAPGSRNNRLFSAACDLAGNGYSQDEATEQLLPIATASGLPEHEVLSSIRSAFSKERTPARPQSSETEKRKRHARQSRENQDWQYALCWATNQPWDGRTGSSDRAMFLALIERAKLGSNEKGVFRASVRELAELAHLGTATVQRALKRLREANLIIRVGQDQNSLASLWHFGKDLLARGKGLYLEMDTLEVPPHWLRYSVSMFNSDLSERGAVGHSVLFVYEYLRGLNTPAMPSEIARGMGISVNRVNYAIARLKLYGLVERRRKGWLLISYLDVEAFESYVRSFSKKIGAGKRREERHKEERRVFAGRILLEARLRQEGIGIRRDFDGNLLLEDVWNRAMELRNDPVVAMGLELGGEIHVRSGFMLSAKGLHLDGFPALLPMKEGLRFGQIMGPHDPE